jgi:hypothetical protein
LIKKMMLTATWHILTTGEVYRDPGGDYFARRDRERQTRRLVAHLEKLGTSSRSNRQRQRHPARSLPEREFLFSSSDNPAEEPRPVAAAVLTV